jgi:hypothetical protein
MNPINATTPRGILLTLLALAACASACRSKAGGGGAGAEPRREADAAIFTRGVEEYLERRGDLCLGLRSWPIDVPADSKLVKDVVQLAVLERLGVLTSTVLAERRNGVATPFNLRRYRLAAEGRAHYLDRETRLPTSPDDPGAAARADFCVVKLTLGKVTKWELEKDTALVSYTYAVEAPAWVRDAGFQKAFPAVARLVAGAGGAELVEGFTLTPSGWTANELVGKRDVAATTASK